MRDKFISVVKEKYFGECLDFRAHIFNTLGFLGCAIGMLFGVYSIFNYAGPGNVIANFGASIAAAWIIWYANRTGAFRTFFLVTVGLVFFILFPLAFFMGGGYHGGMPSFFVFAVVFTVIMLEGRRRTVCAVLEFVLYTGCFLIALFTPQIVVNFSTETSAALDVVVGCLGSSLTLAIAIIRHVSLYDKKQKELEQANDALAGLDRAKTEFIANASHEMRTPLTVVSVNIQTVSDILDDLSLNNTETGKLLADAQSEILRLSRMVGGMLTLASMSENKDRRKTDLSKLLQSGAEMLRLNLGKRGNAIETDIENGLVVFGNADLLTQVLTNLLQNAGKHTENGLVSLSAARNAGEITVCVSDTGTGIAPELLQHVFERGSSADGGTGFGLYLCKTVVESHGGRIWIDSEPKKGTAVFYALPVYEGQFGGDKDEGQNIAGGGQRADTER